MKKSFLIAAGVAALALANVAHSQFPGTPQTSAQKLQAIMAKRKPAWKDK